MSIHQPIKCPACGSDNTIEILSVTAKQAAQHFVIEEGDEKRNHALTSHIRTLWGGDECVVRSCQECGFGYAHPFVAGDALFYNLAVPSVKYPRDKWEFKRTLMELDKSNTADKTCLEIGSGFGFFLDQISKRYFKPSQITATEYNEVSLKLLKKKGYNALAKDIMSDHFKDSENQFDYVFLFQVVEHLDRVDLLFERLSSIVRPHGSAFIAVPNPQRTAFQEASGSLLDMPPNHIGRWTVPALKAISSRHGFTIAATDVEPFSLPQFIIRDIADSYVQRTQQPQTIVNRIRSLPRSKMRRAVEASIAGWMSPLRVPTWIAAMKRRDEMGYSLWARLDRQ